MKTGHDCGHNYGQRQRKYMVCNGVRLTKVVTKIDAMPVTSQEADSVAGLLIVGN